MFDYWCDLSSSLDNDSIGSTDELTYRYHEYESKGKKQKAIDLREKWKESHSDVSFETEELKLLWNRISDPLIDISILPFGCWFLEIKFHLLSPWFSKGLNDFYIIDNPVLRDKAWKIPFCPASTWKGALRMSCRLGNNSIESIDPSWMDKLFGKDKRSDDEISAGRLIFFPSFFHTTKLEVINPHDRERKIGKNPILYEVVPTGTGGIFHLLYFPFDLIEFDERKIYLQSWADLTSLIIPLDKMLRVYGFSAKASSGWGIAEVSDIKILTNIKENVETKEPQTPRSPSEIKLPDLTGLKNIKALWNESGELKILSNKELSPLEKKKKNPNGILSKTQINLYKDAREILQKNLSELSEYEKALTDYRRKLQEYETNLKKETYIELSSANDFDEVLNWIKEKGAVNG